MGCVCCYCHAGTYLEALAADEDNLEHHMHHAHKKRRSHRSKGRRGADEGPVDMTGTWDSSFDVASSSGSLTDTAGSFDPSWSQEVDRSTGSGDRCVSH